MNTRYYLKGALVIAAAVALVPASLLSWKLPVRADEFKGGHFTKLIISTIQDGQTKPVLTLDDDNNWRGSIDVEGKHLKLSFEVEYTGFLGGYAKGIYTLSDYDGKQIVWQTIDEPGKNGELGISPTPADPDVIVLEYVDANGDRKGVNFGIVLEAKDAARIAASQIGTEVRDVVATAISEIATRASEVGTRAKGGASYYSGLVLDKIIAGLESLRTKVGQAAPEDGGAQNKKDL